MTDNQSIFEHLSNTASVALGEAQSLPFLSYIDASVYKLEKEKLLHSDWVFICAENKTPNPGYFFPYS